jgi:hypothetical protein
MIQNRIIAILASGLAISLVLTVSLWQLWSSKKKDYKRLYVASESLHQSITTLQAENGQLIAQNQVLTLKSKEIAAVLPQLATQIRNLDVRLNRAQTVSASGFIAQTPANVVLRDSLVFDTVKIRLFDFQDGFFSVKGKAIGDQQQLDLSYQDTLVQVVYRGERERPWLWIFSPRKLMQRVSLKNPNAQIHYSEYIKIEE